MCALKWDLWVDIPRRQANDKSSKFFKLKLIKNININIEYILKIGLILLEFDFNVQFGT